ncbi:MAG: hypothetical protein AB1390_09230 [Nitrospirota bacterium]
MEIYQFINVCLVVEHAAAAIYSHFMQLFPPEKDFWEDLFKDEKKHISFLIEAADHGQFEEMNPEDLGFSMRLLDRTRKFAEDISDRIKFNPVSLEDALKMALKLEETMVETFTNELIANLSAADDNFLEMFAEGKNHVDKIRNMMINKGFLKLS